MKEFPTIADCIGNTPLVRLQRMAEGSGSQLLVKLEGDNPAGSVKDRPAFNMIAEAAVRGEVKVGDTLIEATSGNTGIALAMASAIQGYRMILIMPESMSLERRACMKAYGAEIILVSDEEGMEGARDLADKMEMEGKGKVLNQFANPDNSLAHYRTTGPEIWKASDGRLTHFISSMGTTGTIMGVSRFLRSKNPKIEIIGVEPAEGSKIPGIRAWPPAYQPKIFDAQYVDRMLTVSRTDAEDVMHRLAKEEGIFSGISSGGCAHAALRVANEAPGRIVVAIVCDRGDRYISTGVYPS